LKTSKRIATLPPYLFATLDKKVSEARASGVDVISFGVGDPDLPTPAHIVEAAVEGVRDPETHQYPSYYGMPELREAIAAFYERRFGVALDPASHILPLIGSKEGIAHLPLAFVDPGDVALIPNPGYPVYATSVLLSGGHQTPIPLLAENGFLPKLENLRDQDLDGAKILWLNYPNNPTSAVCDLDVLSDAVLFCQQHDLLLAHDAAYSEITYDGYRAPSVLQTPGALDSAVEFGSLSKTFNMTGWRVGWAAGSPVAIEALGRVKTNIDSGVFNAMQRAAIAALNGPREPLAQTLEIYASRRDAIVEALNTAGWVLEKPKGSIYLWVPVPEGETSLSFSEFLLEGAGVVVAPGSGYGSYGDGYVRFSLTLSDDRIEAGLERILKSLKER
jgi:LL-diaminopimelate aminotransferase